MLIVLKWFTKRKVCQNSFRLSRVGVIRRMKSEWDIFKESSLAEMDKNVFLLGGIAIAFGLLYWPLESLIHVFVFKEGTFSEQFFHASANEIVMRLLVIVLSITFGIYSIKSNIEYHNVIGAMKLLAKALQQAGDAVVITDNRGKIEYVNKAFIATTGYALSEVKGKNPSILQSGKQSPEFYKIMWSQLLAHGKWKGIIWNKRKNGELYPEELHIRSIYHDNGELSHFVGVFSDIGEQLRLEDQLRQVQKMESIGTLVGGIAHDFNNILTSITGNLFLIKGDYDLSDEIKDRIQLIESDAFRAAEMIQHLLAFARKRNVSYQTVEIQKLISQSLQLVRATLPSTIEFVYDVEDSIMLINGDASQIEQVIINLVNNARDAVENCEKPKISLSVRKVEINESHIQRNSEFKLMNTAVLIEITDNGCGIPEIDQEKIFEPFYTTKDIGKGTGLGLSMIYGTVQSHYGVLELDSKVETGTTFRVYIPVVDGDELPSHQLNDAIEDENGGGELILVVDDAVGVLRTNQELLEYMGYQTVHASDGEHALQIYGEFRDRICLLLTDVVMPNMNGIELAKAIRQQDESLPIIFLTGYERELFAKDADLRHSKVLLKPVQTADLKQAVKEALDISAMTS